MSNTQQTLEIKPSILREILTNYLSLSRALLYCDCTIRYKLKATPALTELEIESGFYKSNYERIYIALNCLKEVLNIDAQTRHTIAGNIENSYEGLLA